MAKSWSWTLPLTQAVADQATVEVPTPDYDENRTDPDSAELAIGNVVVDVPEEGTVEFDGENATVTNLTGDEWAAGDILYVYVKAKGLDDVDGGGGGGDDELETRVSTLESEVAGLKTRLNEVETEVDDLQARVTALEGGGADKRESRR